MEKAESNMINSSFSSEEQEGKLLKVLQTMCFCLLETPKYLEIEIDHTDTGVIFIAKTKPGEEGLLIGREGINAEAIRAILRGYAKKLKADKVFFYVYDPNDRG